MAGEKLEVPVFEKIDGLLVQVDPAKVSSIDATRRRSQTVLSCIILFTPEEEVKRDLEEQEYREQEAARQAELDAAVKAKPLEQRLAEVGITLDELKAAISE